MNNEPKNPIKIAFNKLKRIVDSDELNIDRFINARVKSNAKISRANMLACGKLCTLIRKLELQQLKAMPKKIRKKKVVDAIKEEKLDIPTKAPGFKKEEPSDIPIQVPEFKRTDTSTEHSDMPTHAPKFKRTDTITDQL